MNEEAKKEKIEQLRKNAFIFRILYLFFLLAVATWFVRGQAGWKGIAVLACASLIYLIISRMIRNRYSDAVMDLREYKAFSRVLRDYRKPEKPSDEASFLMMIKDLRPLWEKDVMVRELSTGTFRKRSVSVFDVSYLTAPEGIKQMAVGAAVAVEGKKSRNEYYEWSSGEILTPEVAGVEGIDRILKEVQKKNEAEMHCAAENNRMVFFIRDRVIGSSGYKPGKQLDDRVFSLSPLPELEEFLSAAEIWDRGMEESDE